LVKPQGGKSLGFLPKWLGFKALGGHILPPGFGSRFTLFPDGKLPGLRIVGLGYPEDLKKNSIDKKMLL